MKKQLHLYLVLLFLIAVAGNATAQSSITLTSSDADNIICPGTSVTFTATPGFNNYKFYKAGVLVQDGPSNTYTTSTLTNGQGVYVVATSVCCVCTSTTIVTTVLPDAVVLTSSDADNRICNGASVTFTATAGFTNYVFYKAGVAVQNGASNVYTTSPTNGQAVYVVATNACGTFTSNQIVTTIINLPNSPAIVNSSQPLLTCPGEEFMMQTVEATPGFLEYKWVLSYSTGGGSQTKYTTLNYVLFTIPYGVFQGGTVSLWVRNECGWSNYPTFRLVRYRSSCNSGRADVSGTTMEEMQEAELYPNPTRDEITIELPGKTNENVKVSCYDVQGNLVESIDRVIAERNISIGRKLPTGIFVVTVAKGQYFKRMKFIKTE